MHLEGKTLELFLSGELEAEKISALRSHLLGGHCSTCQKVNVLDEVDTDALESALSELFHTGA